LIEDALTIQATFQKEEAEKIEGAAWIGGPEKSEEVVG
jgi:hypothetical protein